MLEVARVAKRLAKITQFLPAQPAGLLLVGVFTDTQRGIDPDQAGTPCVREDCMQCRHRPRGNHPATSGHAPSSHPARLCRLSTCNTLQHALHVPETDRCHSAPPYTRQDIAPNSSGTQPPRHTPTTRPPPPAPPPS